MPRPPFPKTLREFQSQFASEESCQQYLAACRWPDGFVCPRCGHRRAYELVALGRWQCASCRHQASLTAGTILHKTKTPLTVWFWAAYLMTTDKRGVSALLLQRQLGLGCYETAWMLALHLVDQYVRLVLHWQWGDSDGGPATAAMLYAPNGIALDSSGNLYIADLLNNRVRRVSPDGIIRTIAGTGVANFTGDQGQASLATLNEPTGIAVDFSGNVYLV